MLSTAEAIQLLNQHLGGTPRAAHSRFVAYLMRQFAGVFAADANLWEIVSLCHDLDFFTESSIAELRRPLRDEGRHAFLLILRGEQRVEDAALEQHALGERGLEGAVDRLLGGHHRRQ